MACLSFFGSPSGEQESINRLNSQISTLKQDNQRLKQLNQELSDAINTDDVVTHLQQQRDRLLQKNKELLAKLDEAQKLAIQEQRKCEELRQQLRLRIQVSDTAHKPPDAPIKLQEFDEETKTQGSSLVSSPLGSPVTSLIDEHIGDEEKTTPTPAQPAQERKLNLKRVQDQVMVLSSELMRHKSLLFVCKPQYLQKTSDDSHEIVNFSFLHFVQTSVSDKVVDQLFGKFKSNVVHGKDLLSLLTLLGVIYSVKLHKMQTGDNGKPKLNLSAIKQSLQHLAAYVIRKFGRKTGETESVTVTDDYGHMKLVNAVIIKAQFQKEHFRNDVKLWVTTYMDSEGQMQVE